MKAHSPDDCLSNGERPVLNEALMCIICLFKRSVRTLYPVSLLRPLCHAWGEGADGFFLSRHFVKTLSSTVAELRAGARS